MVFPRSASYVAAAPAKQAEAWEVIETNVGVRDSGAGAHREGAR
jgi:hypothetical protein